MKRVSFCFSAIWIAIATPSFSAVTDLNATYEKAVVRYVDLAASSASGNKYDTLPAGQKYLTLTITNNRHAHAPSATGGSCVVVSTSAAHSTTMDTRIWTKDAGGAFVSLSDNYAGKPFSQVKVFLDDTYPYDTHTGGLSINLYIGAASTGFNAGDFYLTQNMALSQSACFYGTDPFVTVGDAGLAFYYTN